MWERALRERSDVRRGRRTHRPRCMSSEWEHGGVYLHWDLLLLSHLIVLHDGRLSVSRGPLCGSHDTAEAEVICAGRDFAFAPRSNDVAGTILIGAQIRSPAMNFFRLSGLRGIKRIIGSLRVWRNGSH